MPEKAGQDKDNPNNNTKADKNKSAIQSINGDSIHTLNNGALQSSSNIDMGDSILLESQSSSNIYNNSSNIKPHPSSNDDDFTNNVDYLEQAPNALAGNIPLSHIIDRVNTHAYTELLNLVETMPSKINEDKKKLALEYTFQMRQAFVKLIAITRWAKDSEEINKAQKIVALLQSQNEFFSKSVDGVFGSGVLLSQSRIKNYDVLGAIDIFKTGSYNFLPEEYLKRFITTPPLTFEEKKLAISNIQDEIRYRLATGEPIPSNMMLYTVNNGCVTFTVKNEYKISLTMLQFSRRVPWHVVSLEILAGSNTDLSNDLKFELTERQKQKLSSLCQNILVDAELDYSESLPNNNDLALTSTENLINSPASDNSPDQAFDTHPLKDTFSKVPPLVQLNDFLHINSERTVVTIRYWVSQNAASAAPRLNFSNIDKVFSPKSKRGNMNSQIIGVSGENYLRIRLFELEKPRLINSSSSCDSPVFPSELSSSSGNADSEIVKKLYENEYRRGQLEPKHCLRFEWLGSSGLFEKMHESSIKYGSHTHPIDDSSNAILDISKPMFNFDISNICAEEMLKYAEIHHSRLIINNLCTSVSRSGVLLPVDIQLIPESEINDLSDGPMNYKSNSENFNEPLVLRLWYRSKESAIDISVDTITGRLLVKSSSANKNGSNSVTSLEILQNIAISLNQSPWRLSDLLLELRSMLTMSDLEYLAANTHGVEPLKFGFRSSILKVSPGFNIPLNISQIDSDKILKDVLNFADQSQLLIQILQLDFTNPGIFSTKFEWYILISMEDTIEFYLLQLSPNTDKSSNTLILETIYPLKVDALFESITKNSLMLNKSIVSSGDLFNSDTLSILSLKSISSRLSNADGNENAKNIKNAILQGRSLMPLSYLEGLVSTCFAYISTYFVQTQLIKYNAQYSFIRNSESIKPFSNLSSASGFQKVDFSNTSHKNKSSSTLLTALKNIQSMIEFNNSNLISMYLSTNSLHSFSGIDWLNLAGGYPLYSQNNAVKLSISPISNSLDDQVSNINNFEGFYRSNRYCVTIEFPLDLLGLPNSILNTNDDSLESLEVDFEHFKVSSSNPPSHQNVSRISTLPIKKVYYYLESAIHDFINDWSNITLISHIIFIIPKQLIKEFRFGLDKPIDFISQNQKTDSRAMSTFSQSCSICGIANIYSPTLLIKTEISNVFIVITFKPYVPSVFQTEITQNNISLDQLQLQKNSFIISLVRAGTVFDCSTICNHKWNYIPIVCSECTLIERCTNCLKFYKNINPDSWECKKSPWVVLRAWLSTFGLNLSRFGKMQPSLSRLAGMEYYLNILGNVDAFTSGSANSHYDHNMTSKGFKPHSIKENSLKAPSFTTGSKMPYDYNSFSYYTNIFFNKRLFIPKTLVAITDMSMKLLLGSFYFFTIQRYSLGMYTVRGNFSLTDNGLTNSSFIGSPNSQDNSSQLVSLLFHSLVKKFITTKETPDSEIHADTSGINNSLIGNIDNNSRNISPSIPILVNNEPDCSLDAFNIRNSSGKTSDILLEFYQAMKVIHVHENAFICNNEFLAIFLKHFCELVSIFDNNISALSQLTKNMIDKIECPDTVRYETSSKISVKIHNTLNLAMVEIYPVAFPNDANSLDLNSDSLSLSAAIPISDGINIIHQDDNIPDNSTLDTNALDLKNCSMLGNSYDKFSIHSLLDIKYKFTLTLPIEESESTANTVTNLAPENLKSNLEKFFTEFINSNQRISERSGVLTFTFLSNILKLSTNVQLLFLNLLVCDNMWPYFDNQVNRAFTKSLLFDKSLLDHHSNSKTDVSVGDKLEVRLLPFLKSESDNFNGCSFSYNTKSQTLRFVIVLIEILPFESHPENSSNSFVDNMCAILPLKFVLGTSMSFELDLEIFRTSECYKFSTNASHLGELFSISTCFKSTGDNSVSQPQPQIYNQLSEEKIVKLISRISSEINTFDALATETPLSNSTVAVDISNELKTGD
ncbi:Mediator of RNA polymerase II transcription subunit 14 [Smittium culicis]|uniref:Mediator of RNA polymerase II transcription subunit 14 n=1 Tax=Smittium culicis TaxID=133412 RepID=A0A1R1XTC4_9FUNG|nr:Mediator of RNA polymerase II transcription subunit 14 [Smittium culicis]